MRNETIIRYAKLADANKEAVALDKAGTPFVFCANAGRVTIRIQKRP